MLCAGRLPEVLPHLVSFVPRSALREVSGDVGGERPAPSPPVPTA